jgi:hypothetical protein
MAAPTFCRARMLSSSDSSSIGILISSRSACAEVCSSPSRPEGRPRRSLAGRLPLSAAPASRSSSETAGPSMPATGRRSSTHPKRPKSNRASPGGNPRGRRRHGPGHCDDYAPRALPPAGDTRSVQVRVKQRKKLHKRVKDWFCRYGRVAAADRPNIPCERRAANGRPIAGFRRRSPVLGSRVCGSTRRNLLAPRRRCRARSGLHLRR